MQAEPPEVVIEPEPWQAELAALDDARRRLLRDTIDLGEQPDDDWWRSWSDADVAEQHARVLAQLEVNDDLASSVLVGKVLDTGSPACRSTSHGR